MVLISGWKLLAKSFRTQQRHGSSAVGRRRRRFVHKPKQNAPPHEGSRWSGSSAPLFLAATAAAAATATGLPPVGRCANEDEFREEPGASSANPSNWFGFASPGTMVTRTDYLEHDPGDYDVYIRNPKASDLPYLMHQFREHGKEVWPWIWCHPNEDGPHFVFVGVDACTLETIVRLRARSASNNILLIAGEDDIRDAAAAAGDPTIYETNLCGIVSDASLELLNVRAKLLMLSDERVIAFDSLTIV